MCKDWQRIMWMFFGCPGGTMETEAADSPRDTYVFRVTKPFIKKATYIFLFRFKNDDNAQEDDYGGPGGSRSPRALSRTAATRSTRFCLATVVFLFVQVFDIFWRVCNLFRPFQCLHGHEYYYRAVART